MMNKFQSNSLFPFLENTKVGFINKKIGQQEILCLYLTNEEIEYAAYEQILNNTPIGHLELMTQMVAVMCLVNHKKDGKVFKVVYQDSKYIFKEINE